MTCILFDLDGVILQPHPDSPDVYGEGVARAFREWECSPSDDEVASFVGDVSPERMRDVCSAHGLELAEFWATRETRVSALQRDLIRRRERTLYDDVSVLSELAADNSIGIVSNNQDATVEFVVEHFGLDEHVETALGRDPTWAGFRRTKPDPHYLEEALHELGADAGIYVGDRLSDVVAAERADVTSVFVRRDGEVPEGECVPEYEITSLEALPSIVTEERRGAKSADPS